MRYPKAGDLQRATGVEITSNPARQNPYEVHSASGLEGIYGNEEEAQLYADELMRDGVKQVRVVTRHRSLPGRQVAAQNPTSRGYPYDREIATRSLREEQEAEQRYGQRVRMARDPGLRHTLEHARREEQQHAEMLQPFASNPSKRLFAPAREPSPREAIINPAGLTAKGERMYEQIRRGYEERGEPRAKEIASRTVLARSRTVPGLKKK